MLSKQWESLTVNEAIIRKSKARDYADDDCWSLHDRPREQEEEDHEHCDREENIILCFN